MIVIGLTAGSYGAASCLSRSDDWPTVALILDLPGQRRPLVRGYEVADDSDKVLLATSVIPSLIREHNSQLVGLLLSAWSSTRTDLHPAEDPDRGESLLFQLFDPVRHQAFSASIVRSSDQPPSLTPWTKHDQVEGLFIDSIRLAIAANLPLGKLDRSF